MDSWAEAEEEEQHPEAPRKLLLQSYSHYHMAVEIAFVADAFADPSCFHMAVVVVAVAEAGVVVVENLVLRHQ
jgi:hypothetical protein